ncbi:alpha-E domain-containing protein [Alloalcanivorax sp. C16-2]|uniref:alpha-E domain-containing protein n=1 Tax=Alloalcanivorax TaxID=3020832 RepID=UPI0019321004|nr:alpha-E domain-containing protein [Alloalcanivorax marinus]MBL7248989.1 alpha-E domain-containing protein [Alloalcanivorax marinus]
MLSRTASDLYWLSRYFERAENIARMLDVAWNLSLIPFAVNAREEISAPLVITGSGALYEQLHGEVRIDRVLHFFTLDENNPGSIFHCLRDARENAHAVRGKITSEMWESVNSTWLELRDIRALGVEGYGASEFFDWVKNRSHLFRGATYGTSMRNDAFRFLRLGTFIERADNTARILDVRHRSGVLAGDTAVDFYRWHALLRSVGAYEAYREIYSETINAERVAELLILRPEVPRSLRSCVQQLCELLPAIEGDAGQTAKRLAAVQFARLQYGDLGHIVDTGLHEYLTDFLRRINELADTIREEYLEVV